jgi:nucleoside 2-deoxyribosyltransferase
VYLAGPIEGLTHKQATSWRLEAENYFADNNIKTLSPMRNKLFLESLESISSASLAAESEKISKTHPMVKLLSSDQGVMARDFNDCKRADVILAVILDQVGRPSVGTMMEIAFAFAMQKPVILVTDDPALMNHPMISVAAQFKTDDLELGIRTAISLIDP